MTSGGIYARQSEMNIFRYLRSIFAAMIFFNFFTTSGISREDNLFATVESREEFAREISSVIARAWRKWQDGVRIDGVYVDGSQGVLMPGYMTGPVLTSSAIMEDLMSGAINFSMKAGFMCL